MDSTKDILLCCDCEGTARELERMFRAIQNAGIDANFFFVGETVRDHPTLVREIASAHQCESHTDTHANLRKLDKEAQRREILRGRDTIEDLIGVPARGFRAPYHFLNRDTVAILNEEGFTFDASMLYFRYDPGKLQEIHPTWFREWMPLYGLLGIPPQRSFGVFRFLVKTRPLCVLPAHPQYSGRDGRMARAFEDFLKWSVDRGARFWPINEWLHARRGVELPDHIETQPKKNLVIQHG